MPFVLTISCFFDIDYVVSEEQEILIVDQFTGRTMEGRRYSDGLHQAIEAKEGVPIQDGNQDICFNHLPKPFPYVQEIVWYDGYR